jgi:hypothetical protein
LGFFRADGLWSCFLVSLQVHRLWRYEDNVPQKLLDRYGEFPKSVQFEDVHRALRAHGYEPQLIADEQGSNITKYHVPPANILIGVVSKDAEESNSLPAGSVWSMHLSENSDIWARPVKG